MLYFPFPSYRTNFNMMRMRKEICFVCFSFDLYNDIHTIYNIMIPSLLLYVCQISISRQIILVKLISQIIAGICCNNNNTNNNNPKFIIITIVRLYIFTVIGWWTFFFKIFVCLLFVDLTAIWRTSDQL